MILDEMYPTIMLNPRHHRAAVEAAAYSILGDRKMLGVGAEREDLARLAAKEALGIKVLLDGINGMSSDDVNRQVIRDAYAAAVVAAKKAVERCGPMKRVGQKLI